MRSIVIYDATNRLHDCRLDNSKNGRVIHGRGIMYVLHRSAMDGRLEGLKISVVGTVVRRFGYDLGRSDSVRRPPVRGLSCASTISIHCRDITEANLRV